MFTCACVCVCVSKYSIQVATLVSHERTRTNYRVRFDDGTSLSYNYGDDPATKIVYIK